MTAERVLSLNDEEARMILEALAGLSARSGVPEEVTAAMRLAQRIEGFEIDGRPGARRLTVSEIDCSEPPSFEDPGSSVGEAGW